MGTMTLSTDACNRVLGEYRDYLETLTFIQVDPQLLSKFSISDIIQKTLLEAWKEIAKMEALDDARRKQKLRTMLIHNLLDEIEHWRNRGHDVNREQVPGTAVDESKRRIEGWKIAEETPPLDHMVKMEDKLRLLEALSKIDPRQREALILQKYHGWKLVQIAKYMGCTTGAVAGLHSRGLKELRKLLPDLE
jgi:RNA polymerase sigma-70 factor (subfamily 1)